METSLLTDGQVAIVATAILTSCAALAGSIKWAVGRLVKAIDDQTADAKVTREAIGVLRETTSDLRAEVREGRADIRELRELAEFHFGERARPRRRTPATGVVRRAVSEGGGG